MPRKTGTDSARRAELADYLKKLVLACESSILCFAECVCGSLVKTKIPEFHKDIYNLIMKYERLVLAAPRGFAKSTIGGRIYALYISLFKIRKDICIISASESLAIEHLRWIKTELEGNQLILAIWGDLRSDKWTENHLILRHKDGTIINIRAKGAGGQIRGFRPDCLILDDIETDESVESEEQRKKLKEWLFKACLNTLLPGGQLLIIGTVIHPLAVLNDLLETPNGWEKRRYKAYVDGIEEPGHELWGEERPHDWLQQRKREIGSSAFASEFMNDPASDANAPIKSSQIMYWETLPKQLSMCIAVDPAYSDDEKADYKVAVLIGIDVDHNRYLVDYIRTHNPSGEFIDAVLNLYTRHRGVITGLGVPSSGTEREFYNSFVNKAFERKIYAPFVELKNTFTSNTGTTKRNKKGRIIGALQPLFEQGKYFIHANHYEAKDELLTIGSSRWDDLVDAMTYAEQIIQPCFDEPKVHKFDDRGFLVEDEIRNDYGF